MTSEPSPSAGGDPLRRAILTVAGLVGLAAVFVFAVPRREEIAASMRPVAEAPALELEVPADIPMETLREDVAPEAAPEAPSEGIGALPPPAGSAPEAASLHPEKPAVTDPMLVLSRPIALETSTFLVGKARVSLSGIEALPVDGKCDAGGGRFWFCGVRARTALRAWLRARSIHCDVPKDFATSASEIRSECTLGTKDIGSWLVENGWAAAVPGSRYVEAEEKARAARLGIWGEGGS